MDVIEFCSRLACFYKKGNKLLFFYEIDKIGKYLFCLDLSAFYFNEISKWEFMYIILNRIYFYLCLGNVI